MMPPFSTGFFEETIRLRAVFVPRGQPVPSDLAQGMSDMIRIPAELVPDAGGEDAGDAQPHGTAEDDADPSAAS